MSIYKVPEIAVWFHNFPHFYQTQNNSTSYFQDEIYIRFLIVLALLPLIVLAIVLLFLLCYCLIRCSSELSLPRKKNLKPLKIVLGVFVLIASASLAFGLYGNSVANNGVGDGIDAVQVFDDVLVSINSQAATVQSLVDRNITRLLKDLDYVFAQLPNSTLVDFLEKIVAKVTGKVQDVISQVIVVDNATHGLNLSTLHDTIQEIEFDRWSVTIGCFSFAFLVLFLVLCGTGKTSSCLLKTSCFLGIFSLIFCWIGFGIYLSLSVAMGDFCVDPGGLALQQGKNQVEKDIIKYYIDCDKETENPCSKFAKAAQKDIGESYDFINNTFVIIGERFPHTPIYNDTQKVLGALNRTTKALDQLLALLDCAAINKNYNNALNNVCISAFNGVAYILLSCIIFVTLLVVIIIISSKLWLHFSRNRRCYVEIDSEDPFLPPSNSSNESYGSFGYKPDQVPTQPNSRYADFMISTNSNLYHGYNHVDAAESRHSPPPAYESFDNINPSMRTSNQRSYHVHAGTPVTQVFQ